MVSATDRFDCTLLLVSWLKILLKGPLVMAIPCLNTVHGISRGIDLIKLYMYWVGLSLWGNITNYISQATAAVYPSGERKCNNYTQLLPVIQGWAAYQTQISNFKHQG